MSTTKISAGLLMYRKTGNGLEVFLVHLGGPFFKNKPRSWVIPAGLQEDGEDLFTTAKREFTEETGIKPSESAVFSELGSTVSPSGKTIFAWAFEDGGFDPKKLKSNLTPFGWPEIDKGAYFPLEAARKMITPAQEKFLDALLSYLSKSSHEFFKKL